MKIAQIVCTFPPYKGGIGNVASNFADIIGGNHYLKTFTPLYKKREKNLNKNLIYLKPLIKRGNGALIPQLLKVLKEYDVWLLHFPFFGGAEIVWLAKILFGKNKKLIIHYHMDAKLSWINKIFSFPSRLIIKSLFNRADLITCASFDYLEQSLIKKIFGKRKNKFREIPFWVDTEKFFPAQKKENKNNVKILFVGGLDKAHYFKGVDILFYALAGLKEKKWSLEVVGQGELLPKYASLAKKLKLGNRIKFLSNINNQELPKIYRDSDIFVLPSINKNEAFGLALLEAMASGLPVIASDLPGVRKVFTDEKQGFLVKAKNIEDLKEKIKVLINNKALREEFGKNSKTLINNRYSKKLISNKLINIINELK